MNGKFSKLPDGRWGVEAPKSASSGDWVRIRKRDGATVEVCLGAAVGDRLYEIAEQRVLLGDSLPSGRPRPSYIGAPVEPIDMDDILSAL